MESKMIRRKHQENLTINFRGICSKLQRKLSYCSAVVSHTTNACEANNLILNIIRVSGPLLIAYNIKTTVKQMIKF